VRIPLALVAALVLAACGSSRTESFIGLDEPAAVAVFTGVTPKRGELHPYLAIANGGRDDLTLVDAVDGEPVLATVLVRALAVPTATRPYQLVGGSLADGEADLLAVIGAGSSAVEVVDTWSGAPRVVATVPLTPGAEVLSAVAASVPVLDGTEWKAVAGRVRLVLGLTGGRLAVLEFRRDADGKKVVLDGDPVVQTVGFDAVALAARAWPDTTRPAEATDVRYVWAATREDVPAGSGAFGVVEIDSSAAPGAWPVSLVPAGGPTRLVATAHLAERGKDDIDVPPEAVPVDRVYAVLDESGCGGQGAISCGIVIIDPSAPVRGILPDPLGELPYHPPIQLPAKPLAIAAATVPKVPPAGVGSGRMNILPGTGARNTTGVLAVPASDGRVYAVDAGRHTTLNDNSMIREIVGGAQTRTRVDDFIRGISGKDSDLKTFLVIACDESVQNGACEPVPVTDVSAAIGAMKVTPGYTSEQRFTVSYQGLLPGLALRPAEVGDGGGGAWIAFQEPRVPGPGRTGAARVYDPELGVRVGDIVQIYPAKDETVCGKTGRDDDAGTTDDNELEDSRIVEAKVADFVLPDPDLHPGGALLLDAAGLPAEEAACLAEMVAAGESPIRGRVRASGFLLEGAGLGYAGRPAIVSPPGDADLRIQIDLHYLDEQAAAQDCPLVPWPADPGAVTCLGECRDRCERRVLGRKARRVYTVTDACGADVEICRAIWGDPIYDGNGQRTGYTDPLPAMTGPVLEALLTIRKAGPDKALGGDDDLPVPLAEVDRGLSAIVTTASGVTPMYRFSVAGTAVSPTGIVAFDRSEWDQGASYRFYVSFASGLVLDLSPGEVSTVTKSIR
jgi:hypothetical protein